MKKLIFFALSFIFSFGFAQVSQAELRGNIIASPEYPKAYEQVTLRLQSYSFDVDLALITWTVNGKVFDSGLGKKSITIKAGGTGELTRIEARAIISDTDSITLFYNLSPQTVDLVWEAVESYVPPFYEGKALPGDGSMIRVTALPSFVENGRLVNPASVVYEWTMNDQALPSQSGTGKQTLTTKLDYLSDESTISVTARSLSGVVAKSRITIYPTEIKPVFYRYDDIFGLDRSYAITGRLETKKEITFRLIPYFISKISTQPQAEEYSWSLDGLPIKTQGNDTVTLKPKEGTYGAKKLVVKIENTKRYLQQTTAELLVVFDAR